MNFCKLAFILTFVLLTQVIHNVNTLNILAIVSLPLKSHLTALQNVFRELAIRGHSVTFANCYPEKDSPSNLKYIRLNPVKTRILPTMPEFESYSPFYLTLLNFYRNFANYPKMVRQDCETLFNNSELKLLSDRKDRYDVVFVEQFMSDCGLMYAAAMYDAPIIGITANTLLPWAYPRLGIPFDITSDAFYFSNAGTNPSIFHKLESYLMNMYMNTIGRWHVQRGIYEVLNKYVPNNSLDLEELARSRIKMMFVYQHYSFTGARLLSPQVLEIGGIHIRKPKPLPDDLEKFVASAKHGIVYVSFGSNLRADSMSKNKIEQFILAFKKIPQKILWKLDNMTLTAGNDNVLTSRWFPQIDILCHPNVVALVSHGGYLSLTEAAYCGKPSLSMPFFGDQFSSSAVAVESGFGSTIDFQTLNADNLAEAINYITSTKMQENAKRVSKLWHDRPMNVVDSVIYWTEYVARHKSAPPSLPTSSSQNTLIDVYVFIIFMILTIFFLIYFVLKIITFILCNVTIGIFSTDKNYKVKIKRA